MQDSTGRIPARLKYLTAVGILGILASIGLTACGSSGGPMMPDVTGMKLDIAKSDIKNAGFTDDVKVDGGGILGVWDDSNWTVCAQVPAAGQPLSDAPELTVDRTCDDGSSASPEDTTAAASPSVTDAPTSDTPIATPTPTTTTPAVPSVITAKNTPAFAKLLKVGDNCDGSIAKFVKEYSGDTIRFDGSIVDMAPHGSYQTRFDFLLGPGDKGPNTASGPTFKFENNNVFDLHLTGKHVPAYVRAGQKYTFTADMVKYEANSCLLLLNPVQTRTR